MVPRTLVFARRPLSPYAILPRRALLKDSALSPRHRHERVETFLFVFTFSTIIYCFWSSLVNYVEVFLNSLVQDGDLQNRRRHGRVDLGGRHGHLHPLHLLPPGSEKRSICFSVYLPFYILLLLLLIFLVLLLLLLLLLLLITT